ncbi:DUF4167 domain-containing protein [Pseudomonas sp. R2.Fl]|nr:DUF4167 domain-containing protein [Pseudomonas sp. R2.Fl]
MRPGQQNKRRGRGNNGGGGGGGNFNRKGVNPLTRTYDSSGPDVKIRGTAQHIAEKYSALARDAQSSGDRVMAENYLQHAEHYNRIIAAAQAQMQERFQRDERGEFTDRDDDMDMDDQPIQPMVQQPREQQREQQPRQQAQRPEIAGSGPQPVLDEMPAEVAAAVEEAGEAGDGEKQSRRRSQRPRRQPRNRGEDQQGAEASAEAAGGEEGKPSKRSRGGDDAQPLAVAASE